MTPDDLRRLDQPPAAPTLQALWWAARDDWDRAHEAAQSDPGRDAAWVHAYLHRVEGDLENAAYWYGMAQQPVSAAPLDAEWNAITAALLGHKLTPANRAD